MRGQHPRGQRAGYGGRAHVHTPSSCSQVSTRHGCHMRRCHENRNRGTTFSSAACGGSSKEQVRGARFWDPLKTMAGLDISFRLTPERWLLSLLSVAATATSLFPKGAKGGFVQYVVHAHGSPCVCAHHFPTRDEYTCIEVTESEKPLQNPQQCHYATYPWDEQKLEQPVWSVQKAHLQCACDDPTITPTARVGQPLCQPTDHARL